MSNYNWMKLKLNHLTRDRSEKTYSLIIFKISFITEILVSRTADVQNKTLVISQENGTYALNLETPEKAIEYLDLINLCLKEGGGRRIDGEFEVEVY